MTMGFDEARRAVEAAAGWKAGTSIVEDGMNAWTYALADGRITFAAPDARTFVAFVRVGAYPIAPEAAPERERIGRLAAAAMREERSVLSLRGGELELHRSLDLAYADEAAVVTLVTELLNDAARWRVRLSEGGGSSDSNNSSASPFSMGGFDAGAWFPGDIAI